MSDITKAMNDGRSWAVGADDSAVHFVVKEKSGRVVHFELSADCADNIAGALHQASRLVQFRVIKQRGAVGGGL